MNKEELDLLENVFTLAIGECAYNDINNIQKLEYKIKTINNLCKKQKEVIDRKKYLLKEQGAELKELYSEIDKLQGGIDKAIEYLEEPNRDSFDYSKAKLLDILNEVSE